MNTGSNGFVPVPDFLKLLDKKLKYLDALTYASIRSFDGEGCFPMHQTIAARVGLSKRFVIDSIKRLEEVKYITVIRSNKLKESNEYVFNKERTEAIPVDLLTTTELTKYEKAMLICLRQFFNHGSLTCTLTLPEIARWLGITYDKLIKQYKSLSYKGFIYAKIKVSRLASTGDIRMYLSNKLNWPDGVLTNKNLENTAFKKLKVA